MTYDRDFEDRFMISGPPLDTFVETEYDKRPSPAVQNFPPDVMPVGYPEFTQPRRFQVPELEYIVRGKMPPAMAIIEANEEAYQARLEHFRSNLVHRAMAAPITPPNLIDMPMDLEGLPDNNPQYGEIPTVHLPVGYEEALKSALRFPKGKVPPSLYDSSPNSSSASASPATPDKKRVRFDMPAPPPPSPQSANVSPSRIPVPVSKGRKDSRTRESKNAHAEVEVQASSRRKGTRAEASSPYRRTSEGSGSSRGAERSSSTKKGSTRKSL
ncbi:hypothetical protein SCHPADRAFT_942547 [Schizopora paradoxa]|uniref:Uncharacterized protein n=1 Tax=Schizopora paradoxa TaxID=27342 RepID=A0A0H2RGW7_9AGAM|nr:hypothetical protein SCHPADRAFT_942547 [Schizopora paradoxa]